jgi:hypothetical protein
VTRGADRGHLIELAKFAEMGGAGLFRQHPSSLVGTIIAGRPRRFPRDRGVELIVGIYWLCMPSIFGKR